METLMPARILQGTVVSNSCNKTITVTVQKRFQHPVYKKFITRSKKFCAHDEFGKSIVGDIVRIQECRPLSKTKKWKVIIDNDVQQVI